MSMIIGDSHDHEPDNKFQFDRAHKGTCQTLVGRFCLVHGLQNLPQYNESLKNQGGFKTWTAELSIALSD